MPAPDNKATGAQGANLKGLDDLAASINRLEVALSKEGRTSDKAKKAAESLTGKLGKLENQSKRSSDKITLLGRALSLAERGSTQQTLAAREMARSLSETAKVMTQEEAQASQSRVASIGAAADVVARDSRDFAILQKAKRLGNLQIFRDEMDKQAELAKAQQASGNIFQRAQGLVSGGLAKMKSNGAAAAEMVGDFFGVSGEAMGQLAKVAGYSIAIFAAFKAVIERTAASTVAATKAGAELDFSSYFNAIGSAAEYATKTTTARSISMYGINEDALNNLVEANSRYNTSLIASGAGYLDALASGEAYRNQVRLQTVDFVGEQAAVSAALGITGEQGVEMASKLSAASRSGIKPTQQAFLAAALESKRLGISIEAVINPTIMWAEAIAESGENALVAAQKAGQVTGAIEALGNASALGFRNLNPAAMSRFSEGFNKLLTSMEPTRLAALNMRPGESFNSILGRVTEGGSALYQNAIANAMSMAGIQPGGKGKTPNLSNEQALTLGAILGADPSDLVGTQRIGRIAATTQSVGAVQNAMAGQLEGKYNAAEGVGANLLRNNDVMGTMASYIKGILDILIDWGSKLAFAKSDTAMRLSRDRDKSAPQGAGNNYGSMGRTRYRPALG